MRLLLQETCQEDWRLNTAVCKQYATDTRLAAATRSSPLLPAALSQVPAWTRAHAEDAPAAGEHPPQRYGEIHTPNEPPHGPTAWPRTGTAAPGTGTGTSTGPAGAAAFGRPLLSPPGTADTLCSQRGGNHTRLFSYLWVLFVCFFPLLKRDLSTFLGSFARPFCRWKESAPPPNCFLCVGQALGLGGSLTPTSEWHDLLSAQPVLFPEVRIAEDAEQEHDKLCPAQKRALILPSWVAKPSSWA